MINQSFLPQSQAYSLNYLLSHKEPKSTREISSAHTERDKVLLQTLNGSLLARPLQNPFQNFTASFLLMSSLSEGS